MRAAALRTLRGRLARHNDFAAVLAVPRGNAMAPPQLARDAPVVNVAHPLEIRLGVILRDELDFAVFNGFDGSVGERLNLHEPLRREPRLDDGLAAIALAQRDDVILRADQEAAFFEVFEHLLACLETVEPG